MRLRSAKQLRAGKSTENPWKVPNYPWALKWENHWNIHGKHIGNNFLERCSSENHRTKWGIFRCHVWLLDGEKLVMWLRFIADVGNHRTFSSDGEQTTS
jgi:hypothetical protein